jgi:hypothetical protein
VTSIAKGVRFSTYNARSMLVSGVVLLLVIGLFFIPEIVGYLFQGSSSGAASTEAPKIALNTTKVPAVSTKEPAELQSKPSALDKILGLLGAKEPEVVSLDKGDDVVDAKSSATEDDSKAHPGRKKEAPGLMLGEAVVSWKVLKSKPTRKAMMKAHNDALTLATQLEPRWEKSRYALYNLIGGIRLINKGAGKGMGAEEAVQYLELLDSNVTKSMLSDRVPASIYNQWTEITLGPLFEKSRAYQLKMARKMPFDPQLRIVNVKIFQPPDRRGRWIEGGKAYIYFRAGVMGADVKKVSIFRDGVHVMDRTPRRKKGTGLRLFSFGPREARGNYVIRVFDKHNQMVEKAYQFYNPARKYNWVSRSKGRFAIPFGEYDPRLDRLFAFSKPSASRNITFFTSDKNISTF